MKPRRNFEEVAATWDEQPGRIKMGGDIAAAILDRVSLTDSMDVLDFGCGTGLLSLHVADRVKSLTGVDTSPAMLEVFARKAEDLGLCNVRTMKLDLDRGDGISGTYDLIVSGMVFHHIENIDHVLKRLHAALKPSAVLCIADLDLDGGLFHHDSTGVFHNGFDRDEFRRALERAGFKNTYTGLATEVIRPLQDGGERRFSIFLAVGQRC